MQYETKDSGKRVEFESGFKRDIQEGKPRYDLIPHELLTRLAELYARGAEKYGDCNWQKAESEEEFKRFQASCWRHFIQWIRGDEDEDHAMAVCWNIIAYEWLTKYKPKPEPKSEFRFQVSDGANHGIRPGVIVEKGCPLFQDDKVIGKALEATNEDGLTKVLFNLDNNLPF